MTEVVPAVHESADLCVEVFERTDAATWDGLAFDDPQPDIDQDQAGARRRREGGRIVVHHQVQLAVGVGAGQLLEERQELLDDGGVVCTPRSPSLWRSPGGEQGGGAVLHVVARTFLTRVRPHRQHRGGPDEGHDLAFSCKHNPIADSAGTELDLAV